MQLRATPLAVVLAFLAVPQALAAMDAKAVADMLVAADEAALAGAGSYESAAAEGADVVIKGYRFTSADGLTLEQARVVVSDPTPREAGGFTTAKIGYEGAVMHMPLPESLVQALGLAADARLLYREEAGWLEEIVVAVTDGDAEPIEYRRAAARHITLGGPAAEPLGSAEAMSFDYSDQGSLSRLKLAVDGIAVRLDSLGVSLADIGYGDTINGAFALNVAFNEAAASLDVETVRLSVTDVGALTFAASIGGLDDEKIFDAKPGSDEQMLAIYTKGILKSASLRFDNAGIVERLLDKQAKAAGISRTAFAGSLASALPLLLTSSIRDAAFRASFAGAAGAFLKDPKSIAVAGEPDKATPLAQVFFSLENLPTLLRLKVSNGR